ncbi:MAG TPA: deaminase domain-containing protein, partial [Polyangiaceae bacterium]|nr:deaminase domain-containing protein [Polyangiaceae bacterium]
KFTGKEDDVEVGLTYFGRRFLSTHLNRWVTADPLGIHVPGDADLNIYAYVSGQALKAIDPLGLDACGDGGGCTDVGGVAVLDDITIEGSPAPFELTDDMLQANATFGDALDAYDAGDSSRASDILVGTQQRPAPTEIDGRFEKGMANGLVRSFPSIAILEMSGPDAPKHRVYTDIPESDDAIGMLFGGLVWGAMGEAALGRMTLAAPRLLQASGKLGGELADDVGRLRQAFGDKKPGNLAAARFEMDGVAMDSFSAASGPDPLRVRVFQPERVGGYFRHVDSEYKIFSNFANKYQPSVRGRLHVFSERDFCPSCNDVAEQFKLVYPKVEVVKYSGGR